MVEGLEMDRVLQVQDLAPEVRASDTQMRETLSSRLRKRAGSPVSLIACSVHRVRCSYLARKTLCMLCMSVMIMRLDNLRYAHLLYHTYFYDINPSAISGPIRQFPFANNHHSTRKISRWQ